MRESQRRHANELERAQEDLKTCHVEVQRLKEDQPRLAARFHFFQVTRTYVHDLVDCTSTKVSTLAEEGTDDFAFDSVRWLVSSTLSVQKLSFFSNLFKKSGTHIEAHGKQILFDISISKVDLVRLDFLG